MENKDHGLALVKQMQSDGLVREAFVILRGLRKTNPRDRDVLTEYLSWLRGRGMYKEALSEARRWLKTTQDLEIEHEVLRLLRQLERPGDALKLIERILREKIRDTSSIAIYGWALINTGEAERGNKILLEALGTNATDTDILFEVMKSRLGVGDTEGAILPLERAVRENPSDPLTHVYLGRAYRAAGRLLEAANQAHLAETGEGATYRVRYLQGRISVDLGDFASALEVGRSLVDSVPNAVEGHKLMGLSFLGLGELDGALESARLAMKVDSANVEATQLFAAIIKKLPRRRLPGLLIKVLWHGLKRTTISWRVT